MPTTRKSAAAARGVPAKGQSTLLSFSNKVTKSVPKDIKKAVLAPSVAKVEVPQPPAQTQEEVVEIEEPETKEPEVKEPEVKRIEEQRQEEEEEHEEEAEPEIEAALGKSEVELRAEHITEAHIKKYWRSIENQWKTPRLHQGGLSTEEKVLRYFDVNSQYGPCVGMPRMKRWQRAERLGLNPPVEVLAVLLNEENKGNKKTRIAHMDEILNSIAVGQ